MNKCPGCGNIWEPCYLCRRDDRHQQCVEDNMCHDCIMLEKYGEPKERKMIGTFVTAKLFGRDDCRQGYIISMVPLIIEGVSGIHYHCSGEPTRVLNAPPKIKPKEG